jgi:lipid A 3-O-deacylase
MKLRNQGNPPGKLNPVFTGMLFFLLTAAVAPAHAQDVPLPQHFISIQHDNDLLNPAGQETDEYYTAGTYLKYSFLSRTDRNLLNKILFSPGHPAYSFLGIGLTQWMYTPSDLESTSPGKGDYPYSGALFLGLSRENIISPGKRFRSELWLGSMGPSALTRETQMAVHHVIHAEKPEGWQHQLPDYPIINYNLYFESGLVSPGTIKINAFAGSQTGTLLNTLKFGLNLGFSNIKGEYFPDQVYALNNRETHKIKLYIQLAPALELVATNSLLQGSLFGKKNYYYIKEGDLERVLFEMTGMAGIQLKHFSIIYRQIYESREFDTVHGHVYGSFTLILKI